MPDNTQLLMLLQADIAPYTYFHPQRLRFLAGLLTALIELTTVNLAQLALAFAAKPASNYRRIQRFFAEAKLPQRATAALVLHLVPVTERLVISTRRTEWSFDKTPINSFMASLVYQGAAFPLVWMLDCLCSSAEEALAQDEPAGASTTARSRGLAIPDSRYSFIVGYVIGECGRSTYDLQNRV